MPQAWQGLYTAVLEGQQIANPAGWLVLVTFRRAIEEQRARCRAHRGGERSGGLVRAGTTVAPAAPTRRDGDAASGPERDFAAELDDRVRLRQLFEGLRGRLDAREREAADAVLPAGPVAGAGRRADGCERGADAQADGGSRAGQARGGGQGRRARQTIREGDWCEEQGSLMRALAYGILDPEGERYRLALMHRSQCPACRAYVASLRGLAAVLPPVFVPWGLGAGVLAHAAADGAHAGGRGRRSKHGERGERCRGRRVRRL